MKKTILFSLLGLCLFAQETSKSEDAKNTAAATAIFDKRLNDAKLSAADKKMLSEDLNEFDKDEKTWKEILTEGLEAITQTYGFSVLVNDPTAFFSFGSNDQHFLKGKMKTYMGIVSLFLLFIILMSDIIKYAKSSNKDEMEKNFNINSMIIKYIVIGIVMGLPNVITSLAITARNIIAEPMEMLIKGEEKQVRAKNISILKTYIHFANLVYEDNVLTIGNTKETINVPKKEKSSLTQKTIDRRGFSNMGESLKVTIFYSLADFLFSIQDIGGFVLKTLSTMLVYMCSIFFPLAVMFEYIPGFSGGVSSLIKYIVNFSLWGVIMEAIQEVSKTLGGEQVKAKIYAILNDLLPVYENGDVLEESSLYYAEKLTTTIGENASFGNLLLIAMTTLLVFIVPKISDMLISGSQSGAFFSAVTAMATGAIKKTAGAATGGLTVGLEGARGLTGKAAGGGSGPMGNIAYLAGKGTKDAGKASINKIKNVAKSLFK